MVAIGEKHRRRDQHRNGVRDRDREDERGRDGGGELMTRMRGGASGALHSVIEGAHAVTQQLRGTTSEVTSAVLDTVLDEAERIYRKRKKPALSRISSLSKMADRTAHALHAVKADGVAEYVEQAADQVGTLTDYLDDCSLGEILEDTGEVVQRNRGVAMAGMFIVGFALARFLKASESRDDAGEQTGAGEADDQDDEHREAEPAPRKQKRRAR